MGDARQIKSVGASFPDKTRVFQINYIGERSPDKNIWVRVRPIKNMGESLPGQAYGRELASPNI